MNSLYAVNLFDIYEKNTLLHKDRCAIHWKDQDTTYSELFDETCQLANGLKSLGLSPNARVAVLSKNHPCFFHLFGAVAALNLCLVFINRRLSPEEIAYIVEDTAPEAIIWDKEMEVQAGPLVSSQASLKHSFIVEETLSDLYCPGPFSPSDEIDPSAPYVIIHTAAVQGKPRGAVLSQENLILSNFQLIHTFGLDHTKAYLNILPLFHIMGVNLGLSTLMAGGKNVILEKFTPQLTLDLIQEQKITIFGSFPPILTTLLDAIEADAIESGDHDLSSLEIAAGLEMPDTVTRWETATPSTFWTMYGQTETSGLISFSEYTKQPGSAGIISQLAKIAIADDQDNLLPQGSVGEILVRGPLVFKGYWNAKDLNELTFRQGWHHTGDLGLIDAQGFLFFKGRKAERELIKPGGENVFPAEVEKAILKHDAVEAVCVFGVPDPKFGEGIKAVITLSPNMELTKEEVIEFTGSLIAGYKKPRYVEFVDALPKTGDGNLDRIKIKETYS